MNNTLTITGIRFVPARQQKSNGLRKIDIMNVLIFGTVGGLLAAWALSGVPSVQDKILSMEKRAFESFNKSNLAETPQERHQLSRETWECMKDIQKLDPMNASVQYLAGLMAYANGNDGLPMIMEAARRGSGLAESWLRTHDKECPCQQQTAGGGGTGQTGN